MATKLEALVEYLIGIAADGEVVDTLIIEYFKTPDKSSFQLSNGQIFDVLNLDQYEEEKYDYAEEIFFNFEIELQEALRRKPHLQTLVDTLDQEECIAIILKQFDEDEYLISRDKDLVDSSRYYIFLFND